MDSLEKRFGRLLASHRRRSGSTQGQLAELAGISVDMVAKLETGAASPSFRTIGALANALDVDAAEFFTADLPTGRLRRPAFQAIMDRLVVLPDEQMAWIGEIIDAALKGGRRS